MPQIRKLTIEGISDDRRLILGVPGERGYTVKIRMDDTGWAVLTQLLEDRERANPAVAGIGTNASPTQAMIEEFIKAGGVRKLAASRTQALKEQRYLETFGADADLDLEIDL